MKAAILRRVIFMFLVICVALSLENGSKDVPNNKNKRFISSSGGYNYNGYKRAKIASKPGFFRTLFSAIYEQWVDTKNTTNYINNAVESNFLPEHPTVAPSTTTGAPNVSTTTPQYKISRSEFLRILRRNIKGINRLYNLELQDARKQTHNTYSNFKNNLTNEISKFL